ncbi:MAG: hypothetical protein mread185_000322 [Mycoplasmataceae bacterium]|nr:MAG: hypothetical protein mread185_000322 [Mycoplasmataceae bacterium]
MSISENAIRIVNDIESIVKEIKEIKEKYAIGEDYKMIPKFFEKGEFESEKKLKEVVEFVNENNELKEIELGLEEYKKLKSLFVYLDKNSEKLHSLKEFHQEKGSSHGLGTFFAVLMIKDYIKNGGMKFEDSQLGKTLKFHTYLNSLQVGVDSTQEIYGASKLISEKAFKKSWSFGSIGKNGGKLLSRLGPITAGINFLLDCRELNMARNEDEKLIFKTRLALDTVGLAVTAATGGWGAIPWIIVDFSTNNFIEKVIQNNHLIEESKHVVEQFWQYDQDYGSDLKVLTVNNNKILPLSFRNPQINSDKTKIITKGSEKDNLEISQAVIKEIDLTNSEEVKITFDSQYIHGTSHWVGYDDKKLFVGKDERPTSNNEIFNIREILHKDEEKSIKLLNLSKQDRLRIFLPIALKCNINYSYSGVPFSGKIEDHKLKVIREIQESKLIVFHYNSRELNYDIDGEDQGQSQTEFIDQENTMTNLDLSYVITPIKINLGNREMDFVCLISPPNNAEKPEDYSVKLRKNISYEFECKNSQGKFYLTPVEGVKYIISNSQETTWTIINNNREDEITVTDGLNDKEKILNIGKKKIIFKFEDGQIPNKIKIQNGEELFKIDISNKDNRERKLLFPIVLNGLRFENIKNHAEELGEYIKKTLEHNAFAKSYVEKERYIEFDNYLIKDGRLLKKIWYDTKSESEDKLIYLQCYDQEEAILIAARKSNHLYYFLPERKLLLYQEEKNSPIEVISNGIEYCSLNGNQVIAKYQILGAMLLLEGKKKILRQITDFDLDADKNIKERLQYYKKKEGWLIPKILPAVKIVEDDSSIIKQWYIDGELIKLPKNKTGKNNIFDLDLCAYRKKDNLDIYYFFRPEEGKIYWKTKENELAELELKNLSEKKIIGISQNGLEISLLVEGGIWYSLALDDRVVLSGVNERWLARNEGKDLLSAVNSLLEEKDLEKKSKIVTILNYNKLAAYYLIDKGILVNYAELENKLVGYDKINNRKYLFNKNNQELFYTVPESGNAKNYWILKKEIKNNTSSVNSSSEFGGNGGVKFDDLSIISKRLENEGIIKSISPSKIEVRSDHIIDSIRFTYKAEKEIGDPIYITGDQHGEEGGSLSTIELKDNECIKKITVQKGDFDSLSNVITKLIFHIHSPSEDNSDIKIYQFGQGANREEFTLFQENASNVVAIFGRSCKYLDAIGVHKNQKKQELVLEGTDVLSQTKVDLPITIVDASMNENDILMVIDKEGRIFALDETKANTWGVNLIRINIDEKWLKRVGAENVEVELTKLVSQKQHYNIPIIEITYADGRKGWFDCRADKEGKKNNKLTTIKKRRAVDENLDDLSYIGINEADQKIYLFDSRQKKLLRVDDEKVEISELYNFKVENLDFLGNSVHLQIRGNDKKKSFEIFENLPLFQGYSSLLLNIGYKEEVLNKGKMVGKKKEIYFKEEVFKNYKKVIIDLFSSNVVNYLVFKNLVKDDFEFVAEGSDCIMTHKKTKSRLTIAGYEQKVGVIFEDEKQKEEIFFLQHNTLDSQIPNLIPEKKFIAADYESEDNGIKQELENRIETPTIN